MLGDPVDNMPKAARPTYEKVSKRCSRQSVKLFWRHPNAVIGAARESLKS
jgi:hypothetical protein